MNFTVSLFDRIAPIYDQMNKIMSFGQDGYWRKALVSYIPWNKKPKLYVIDMACGTGALTQALLKQGKIQNQFSACWMMDPSTAMLEQAKQRKYDETWCKEIHFLQGYAESVMLPSNIAHVYMSGFGLRNMENRMLALQEAFRLLKPGGIVLMLEFSFEVLPALAWAYRLYLLYGIPFLGKWLAKEELAYEYLSESICKFPPPSMIVHECLQEGFQNVGYVPMCAGIVQLYYAHRPNDRQKIGEI